MHAGQSCLETMRGRYQGFVVRPSDGSLYLQFDLLRTSAWRSELYKRTFRRRYIRRPF